MRRALLVCFLLIGAACERDSAAEARMLLDRVQSIDLDSSVAERTRLVDSLATVRLTDPELVGTRDVCVDAHRAILEAEGLQAQAAERLEGYASEEVPSAGDQLQIRRDIETADREIQRSRELFTRCHEETRALDVRYRRR